MDQQAARPVGDAPPELTHEELLRLISYDPITGIFIRRRDGKNLSVNKPDKCGRLRICINYKRYLAHRLAWFYVHGVWPVGLLDHRNRKAGENSLSNLRPASRAQNAINSDATWSVSGMRGVYPQKGTKRWRVKIARVNVGYFATKEEAAAAYRAKAVELYGEFACG